MRNLALLLLLSLATLSLGCGSTSTQARKLGDGSSQVFSYEAGVPSRASNVWASVQEASFMVGQKRDGTGADFWWQFAFNSRIDDLQLVVVYDVTSTPPVRVIEDRQPRLQGRQWSGRTPARALSRDSVPWLFEPGTSERVFKFVLRNADGEEKALYQPSAYDEQTKNAIRQALSPVM